MKQTHPLRTKLWTRRLERLAAARSVSGPLPELRLALVRVLDLTSRSDVWVGLYALSGRIPGDDLVLETLRRVEFEGPDAFVEALGPLTTTASAGWEILPVAAPTLLDVGQTASTDVRTGIQRVALEVLRRWARAHRPSFIGWTEGGDALRYLTRAEVEGLGLEGDYAEQTHSQHEGTAVVPLGGSYICPEVNLDPYVLASMLSLGRNSVLRTGVIGFDCVPITSAETTARGVPAAFSKRLAALRHFDRVVAISEAAATEFRGWRRMLGGTGLTGPEICVVPLAEERPPGRDPVRAELSLASGPMPVVLVVGSQEPRKNHTAVLAAAERLWSEGARFSLSLVSSQGWEDHEFDRALTRLQGMGRPIAVVSGLPDAALASAYELARFSVFPSLNEGFGLPVAESLALGTPVITSGHGSMREIALGGGALLVDPRQDDELEEAMRRLLIDDELLAELTRQALARPERRWDDYAAEAWDALTTDQPRAATAAS